MAIVITNDQHYAGIADAIREKNGEGATYKPSEMAAAILEIMGGNVKKVTSVNVYENIGMYTITYEGGQMVTGSVTFDENGLPTSLTDDRGNTVNFTMGYPTSATDSEGNIVSIIWG